jgi:hypothetical protein
VRHRVTMLSAAFRAFCDLHRPGYAAYATARLPKDEASPGRSPHIRPDSRRLVSSRRTAKPSRLRLATAHPLCGSSHRLALHPRRRRHAAP